MLVYQIHFSHRKSMYGRENPGFFCHVWLRTNPCAQENPPGIHSHLFRQRLGRRSPGALGKDLPGRLRVALLRHAAHGAGGPGGGTAELCTAGRTDPELKSDGNRMDGMNFTLV